MAKLAIKSDNKKQNLPLPPSLDELVPKNHMVRVVDAVIDRLDISEILSTYHGGGNSAFNPKMMLKVLVLKKRYTNLKLSYNTTKFFYETNAA